MDEGRLSWLIPTGESDIAVQRVLAPLFGDAISCKVPGAVCGAMAPTDGGSLLATMLATFNSMTMIFATIVLVFIGIVGMVKTAQDGEFLGRSWNTTFTALRLVVGICFLLPMPNNYSTIQNFVLYVGLWSSGAANLVTNATAEHYLRRLQVNMTADSDPSSVTVRNEAPGLLAIHTCAALANQRYGSSGANLVPRWADLGTGARAEFAYVEEGSYLSRGSAPCGRLVVEPKGKTVVDPRSGVPEGAWNLAFFSDPFSSETRKLMASTADQAAKVAREAKLEALRALASPNGNLARLGQDIAGKYERSQITYNQDGSVAAKPVEPEMWSPSFSDQVIQRYAGAVRQANAALTARLDAMRASVLEQAGGDGQGSFFAAAKKMLNDGGWMGTAMVHRTMLDMVSVKFAGEAQAAARIEPAELLMPSSGAAMSSAAASLPDHVRALQAGLDALFVTDTARTQLASSLGAAEAGHGALPAVNRDSVAGVVRDPSLNGAFEVLYGGNFLQRFRTRFLSALGLSERFDPLYQVKTIGDTSTATAEYLVLGQMSWNAAVSAVDIAGNAATSNVVGQATGANGTLAALLRSAERVMAVPVRLAGWIAGALAGLGYLFSTWLPALPVIALMMAQVGWVLGLLMTLFAINIWAVLHLTPASHDTFVGSQAQGYLLLAGLFFRPIIAVTGLSISFLIAPVFVGLLNTTLLPALFINNVSTNTLTIIAATLFGLTLYFVVAKAVLVMTFMLPQTFPDEVLRFVGAGSGDLGQSRGIAQLDPTVRAESADRTALDALRGRLAARDAEGMPVALRTPSTAPSKLLDRTDGQG